MPVPATLATPTLYSRAPPPPAFQGLLTQGHHPLKGYYYDDYYDDDLDDLDDLDVERVGACAERVYDSFDDDATTSELARCRYDDDDEDEQVRPGADVDLAPAEGRRCAGSCWEQASC